MASSITAAERPVWRSGRRTVLRVLGERTESRSESPTPKMPADSGMVRPISTNALETWRARKSEVQKQATGSGSVASHDLRRIESDVIMFMTQMEVASTR